MFRTLKNISRGFRDDLCYLRASALSYYTLLSIVPVLAVAFGVAKGFGLDEMLKERILVTFEEHPEIADKMVTFAYSALESARGGLIAGVGVAFLFWVVYNLLNNVEKSINAIWDIEKGRPFGRKLSNYLAMMVLGPVIIVIASSSAVFLATEINQLIGDGGIMETISPIILFSMRLFPLLLSWILFSLIYLYMPNTKVRWKRAVIAGIIGGTIYQCVQWAYIHFQIGVSNYGAIYGSFAALPLFLMWMHISWLIVLLGAEIAYQIGAKKEEEEDYP